MLPVRHFLMLMAAFLSSPVAAERIALLNVRVIDGTGAAPRHGETIIIENRRISAVYKTGSRAIEPGTRTLDLQGLTVMPGLIDAHVHLSRPSPQSSISPTERATIARTRESDFAALLRSGVTTVRELAGDASITVDLKRRQASGEIEGPAIRFAAVFFGPQFMSDPRSRSSAGELEPGAAPWSRLVTPELDIPRAMAEAKATGAAGVKLYASLTADQLAQLSNEARRHGLLVWTHTVVFPTGTVEALAAGVDTLVHAKGLVTIAGLEGIPNNFAAGTSRWMMSRDYANIEPDGPAFRAAYAAMVRQGTILEPALTADGDRASQPLPPERAAMRDWACRATRAAHRAGVAIGAGTDTAGEPFMLQRELARLVECGLSPLEAIRAATQTNARALGMGHTHGTIEVGKAADLVAVAGDPAADIGATDSIRLVIQAGRVVVRPD